MLWCSLSCRALQNFPPISLTAIRIHRCPVFKKEGIPYEKNSHGKQILKPHYNLSDIPSTLLTPQDADAFDQICFSGYSAAELAKSGEYQNKVSTNPSGGLF
jgi:hypothetical protein